METLLSFHDVAGNQPEKVYHAFVLGLLAQLQSQYIIRSNRESGYGRHDVMMIPKDKNQRGVIFEFKQINSRRAETREAALESALNQIEQKHYAADLIQEGVTQIDAMAIVIDQKKLWMKTVKLT